MKRFDPGLFNRLDDLVINYPAHERAFVAVRETIDAADRYHDHTLLPVIGPSGGGKTKVLQCVLKHYQEAAAAAGTTCPVRYMMLPRSKKTRAVLMKLLHVLGYPLYYLGSEDKMQIRVIEMFVRTGCKGLLLDETQHCVSPNGVINFEIADLFKTLVDEARLR